MQLLPLPGTTPEMWDNIGMKLYACVNVYLSRYLIYENVYVHLCMCMHMYICRSVYMYNYALSKSVQGKEKNITQLDQSTRWSQPLEAHSETKARSCPRAKSRVPTWSRLVLKHLLSDL